MPSCMKKDAVVGMDRRGWAALTALVTCLACAHGLPEPAARPPSIHTVVVTSCEAHADWQCMGLYFSFLRARQPGAITRLASCTLEELRRRTVYWAMPTWVVPSMKQVDGD
jgi:hypothetical protein